MAFNLPEKVQKLTVCIDDKELGVLTHDAIHDYKQTQNEFNLSLTMTEKGMDDSYRSGALHPIFAQNLPEGHNRRYIAQRLARYAKVNDMYLLALQGSDGIGMLSYQGDFKLPQVDSVPLNDILTYSDTQPLFPQLLEKYYLRNTLSGMQPKVSIPSVERTVHQKDLIVKSFDEEFELLTVNEYVCMQAAKYCGLAPPNTYLSDNLETFVIERFDRGENGTQLLGYEDFTTLMKRSSDPDEKYRGSYETLLKATYLYTNNMLEVEKMYKYIVFSCLIGNGDAHLKNFALQYTPDMSNIFVSPPFDITHTLIYSTINNKMALNICKSKEFPDYEHLIKLANQGHIVIRNAQEIVESLAQGIIEYVSSSQEVLLLSGLKESILAGVDKVMTATYNSKSYRHDKKKKFE